MKKLSFILLAISFTIISCNSDDSESQKKEDYAKLTKMYDELLVLSQSETQPCTNPDEWAYVKLGEVCEGEFDIIYSKKINTEDFLNKAEKYTKARDIYLKKWKEEDCGEFFYYHGKPTSLDCYKEKPILLYNNNTIPK